MPEKKGYIAPFSSYLGTDAEDTDINIGYYTFDYVVISRYVFEDGTKVMDDLVDCHHYKDTYTIYAATPWPGYKVDKTSISGVIDDNTKPITVVTFTYTKE